MDPTMLTRRDAPPASRNSSRQWGTVLRRKPGASRDRMSRWVNPQASCTSTSPSGSLCIISARRKPRSMARAHESGWEQRLLAAHQASCLSSRSEASGCTVAEPWRPYGCRALAVGISGLTQHSSTRSVTPSTKKASWCAREADSSRTST